VGARECRQEEIWGGREGWIGGVRDALRYLKVFRAGWGAG